MPDGVEGLRIFQLAEELADAVWDEVAWKPFAKDRSGDSLSRPQTRSGETSPKATGDIITGKSPSLLRPRFSEGNRVLVTARAHGTHRRTLPRSRAKVDELEPQLNAYIHSFERKAREENVVHLNGSLCQLLPSARSRPCRIDHSTN